ncbi:hypothetical protein RJ639_008986 [Escallonia herrerae]|uniref:WRKY domain-containing protein n=1 Tax=Escallonia herrerae TaxID=1293975 RepID=A0AA88VTB3_9ASTE|nr:hypothetical protein RJ639_008986 [Escallonia herrerae]
MPRTVSSTLCTVKMEIKEAERTTIAKPVASRPSSSNFRSFSELLAGAVSISPSNGCYEAAVTAIRPKTVRFKPAGSCPPVEVVSSEAEVPGTAVCASADMVFKSDSKPTILYKPLAKPVSKSTITLLANMGNSNISHQQALAEVEDRVRPFNQVYHHLRPDMSSNLNQNVASLSEKDKMIESPRMALESLEDDQRSQPPTSAGDRPSYDGYNWRKYGQKQVKGSEYPRSYYKCTHPNCPVKKKVERSLDGQIAEIVYKGEHNHSKPQPPRRNNSGVQSQGLVADGAVQDSTYLSVNNHFNERNEGSEARIEDQIEVGLSALSSNLGKTPLSCDPVTAGAPSTCITATDNSCGLSGDCEEGSKGLEAEDEAPRSKRRRKEAQPNEAVLSGEATQEPRVVVQNSTDSETIGDGYRWRKYGQKVVKGNPYPRSYYRCTGLKCNVRKHVERASDDLRAFITTYEGKHNHDMPIKSANLVASEPDTKAVNVKEKS